MNFGQFDSRGAAETGAWMQVNNPVTGVPIFDGDKPCRVLVAGMEGRAVIKKLTKISKTFKRTDLTEVEANLKDRRAEASALILEFENIENAKGEPLDASKPADVDWFLDLGAAVGNPDPRQRTFVQQINDFAADRANFLSPAALG